MNQKDRKPGRDLGGGRPNEWPVPGKVEGGWEAAISVVTQRGDRWFYKEDIEREKCESQNSLTSTEPK
jgi:hypothetical protein